MTSLTILRRRCRWMLVAVALAGCGILFPKADPTRFYVLAAVADATASSRALAVGLGPIVLPSYLQRPELALRVGPNEVRFRELDRWAGSLPAQVGSVLGEDIRRALGADRVVLFPWYSGTKLDLVMELQMFRFEPDRDGQAHLLGHWRLRDAAKATDLTSADVDLSEKVPSPGPDGEVAALSQLLARLARQVADAAPPGR